MKRTMVKKNKKISVIVAAVAVTAAVLGLIAAAQARGQAED
jgi:hypothetical protein